MREWWIDRISTALELARRGCVGDPSKRAAFGVGVLARGALRGWHCHCDVLLDIAGGCRVLITASDDAQAISGLFACILRGDERRRLWVDCRWDVVSAPTEWVWVVGHAVRAHALGLPELPCPGGPGFGFRDRRSQAPARPLSGLERRGVLSDADGWAWALTVRCRVGEARHAVRAHARRELERRGDGARP